MISVIRNTHMPMTAASVCCSMVAKWCCRSGLWVAMAGGLSANGDLLRNFVVVASFPRHDRGFLEIERGRRRTDLPLQASRIPRILRCRLAVAHRPQKVHHREKITDS